LGFVGTIDGHGATLLAGCDGTRTVGEQIATLAGALKTTREAITPASLGIIRRLIEQGFLQTAVPAAG
jgi:predicted small secreted protein